MEEMKNNESLLVERKKHVPRGAFNIHPVFVKHAKGSLLIDVDGNRYIDFSGGIGVVNVGHCHERVLSAVEEQTRNYIHTCFHVVMHEPYVALAKKLNHIVPGNFPKKTMFANSGAEAVENAVKIARHATERPATIAFENAFHGRTLLALSLTSKSKPYKYGFGPYAPEIYRMPYAYCYRCNSNLRYPSCGIHCAHSLRDYFNTHVPAEQVAALIVEPVLGEGGFVVPPKEYFGILQAICREAGIVFIADEVQTGFGRTGRMFAMEHYGVAPDIMITGKSIAAGFPLSGITGRSELMDHPQVGGLGGTYGGNPVSCAAALAVLDIFEKEDLLSQAQAIGKTIMDRFLGFQERYEVIGDVRGLGAMVCLELVTDRKTKKPATDSTKKLVNTCREKGLLMIAAGTFSNIIRPLMPLVITDDELDEGLSILEEGLAEISG